MTVCRVVTVARFTRAVTPRIVPKSIRGVVSNAMSAIVCRCPKFCPAFFLIIAVALGLTSARAGSLPDTGQDLCDNGANILVVCTSANTGDIATYPRQDGRFGRDAKATSGVLTKIGGGAAGFDYSKIANNGSDLGSGAGIALGSNPTDWACTRDNITGLTWEVKVNDATHLRHKYWGYTWYDSNSSTNAGNAGTADTGVGIGSDNCLDPSRCDTEKFVVDVNATRLCGYSDWRMPTQRELLTLTHAGAVPAIDLAYFPNTIALLSGSSYVRDPRFAWGYDFVGGGTTFQQNKAFGYFVILVRGEQF